MYKTEGVRVLYQYHSEDIRKALERFISGDFGSSAGRPSNELIRDFGCYQLEFGMIFIISYKFFTNRDFITILLKEEYDGKE